VLSRSRRLFAFATAAALLGSVLPAAASAAPASSQTFTILHTNDFHGQLEASSSNPNAASNPGIARDANVINMVRAAKGADRTLLVDAGDEMQGSLLSNLGDGTATGKGSSTIAAFNAQGYGVATFGNHEFDWGQANLAARTTQATYKFVTANIVKNNTGDCATAAWQKPDFASGAYEIKTIGTAPNQVKVAFIGVTTTETPTITVASATAGLCFKDPADSIVHYYDEMKTAGADVIVVLSHLGYVDGGYGYGLPVYGDQTLAARLNTAGKPANLIIGGHSHTSVAAPGTLVGTTLVTQAAYNGRRVGEADITVGADGAVSVNWKVYTWTLTTVTPPAVAPPGKWVLTEKVGSSVVSSDFADATQDAPMNALITSLASDPTYVSTVNQPIGYSSVDLPRGSGAAPAGTGSGNVDNMMGTFIDDAIYNYLNTDSEAANDVDLFFNNAGGIRTEWCWSGSAWVSTSCTTLTATTHAPALLTYGNMFTILPFGNATAVGTMTGAQILDVVNYGPNVAGVIQPAGLKYKYYSYKDANPGPQPYAWGAYDVMVKDRGTGTYVPLDLKKTYKVGTNEFLAPAGGDGYNAFKYMAGITYWGDMLNAVNSYVSAHYGTTGTAYAGPNGDGTLDGRIVRDGTDTTGSIVPVTILHNNDSHGNLAKTAYVGYTQLATLIKQERLHNPTRTLLLDGGDQIQGDAMMYYFKSSYTGNASDGTALPDALKTNPMMAVMNSLGYDAMTLGNHEFNYGSAVFKGILGQATFPVLGANVTDTGAYGLSAAQGGAGVKPYIEKTVGAEGIKVGIIGITNHRVPNYELPSNIPGLTFSDPIAKAQVEATLLKSRDDAVVALTHIGFTENAASVEVDANVDTNMAAQVTGLDAIVGSHSHTDPSKQTAASGAYKYLPAIVAGPGNTPVAVTQAYRYNNYLGEVVLGMRAKAGGGYEVVTRAGRYLTVSLTTVEDAATKAIVDPYVAQLNTYNNTVVGQTTVPIDTMQAFVAETNGANLQADASVWSLAQHGITDVDVHLSGAMTNKLMAAGATPAAPVTLKISDMFGGMPYENSLVVLRMNGPQIKAVLERAYRNYYYYKYVTGYGGYSYYTTCMIDTNSVGKITYNDLAPAPYDATKSYVASFTINGHQVDFANAAKYYNVSTVNYLAAGSCNFNDNGVSLWPLNQIVHDTQYYVRDVTIDYIKAKGTVSPAIEGRLAFINDTTGPVLTVSKPTATTYVHPTIMKVKFGATDTPAGILSVTGKIGSKTFTNGQTLDLRTLPLGANTMTVTATDRAGNKTVKTVKFTIKATINSLISEVGLYRSEGAISKSIAARLIARLNFAKHDLRKGNLRLARADLALFAWAVALDTGHGVSAKAAKVLIADAAYVRKHTK
jgi:2',3'-cyclic-nucleotide 2'-phosphodiesterase (5'-nucleotidase family)